MACGSAVPACAQFRRRWSPACSSVMVNLWMKVATHPRNGSKSFCLYLCSFLSQFMFMPIGVVWGAVGFMELIANQQLTLLLTAFLLARDIVFCKAVQTQWEKKISQIKANNKLSPDSVKALFHKYSHIFISLLYLGHWGVEYFFSYLFETQHVLAGNKFWRP